MPCEQGEAPLKTLEEIVRERLARHKSLYETLYSVYRDVREGKLKLVDPEPPTTLAQYLRRLDYSLWFWTTAALIAAAITSIWASSVAPQLLPLRYILGTLYVLFIPGYVLVEALYPEEKSLAPLERLALSIGLSLAIIPLIGLLLNYTPWGIRLEPIVTSTAVYNTVLLLIAAYRKLTIVRMEAEALGIADRDGRRRKPGDDALAAPV
ncbi:protein of unknown function DUF1616 [Pyrolobus fumarii 1A]|uniref:DUF1616 domain-containing protein n=1 Tax=Pyrolobus fumarii (strain DSM 11204 / 1A) TaxID=694429 RepID=G0EFG1_PYRF1|nr:DUF1616 domain-containing protein [Pyrolobus fumarii]AEM38985.1 protein of unknown function DUF1616 [Pyrolobus fumarii 1A]